MKKAKRTTQRRGVAMVLVVVALIPILAFTALAIDLGLLTVARTQLQETADASAMAGARTLNGSQTNNNYSSVSPQVLGVATSNSILSQPVQSSQVTMTIGRYVYSSANQRFEGQFPGPTTENWSMVKAQVSANVANQMAFSKVIGFSSTNMQATGVAAHRPRDVSIILDYSGSMRYASLLGTPTSGDRTTNNPDSLYPQLGHYTSGSAQLQASSFTMPYAEANITSTTSDNRAPVIADFYTDSNGSAAFSKASNSYATTPGGDNHLKSNKNTGSSYAQTAASLLNITSPGNSSRDNTFETSGYTAYGMAGAFNRYTQGPGYWGKTFFAWPPDPANGSDGTTNDWRKRYFYYGGTTTAMDDNSKLWDSSGNWRAPSSSNYSINYAAILNFIKNIGPNPFPSRLQSGRIVYYDSIPTTIDTSSYPPSDMNQRFWKDYIDYVLGVLQTGGSSWTVETDGSTGNQGYGADYTWGTVKITAKSSLTSSGTPAKFPYMHYGDNPLRPRLHFWFGPLSMIDFLGNYNMWGEVSPTASRFCWWPGTCHESPMYACKLGIRAALTDINNNHPNDLVAMIMFSAPMSSSTDADGRFNRPRVGLSRNYNNMLDSLWYPPSTIGNSSATVRPYASDNLEVPRAYGGTCYAMPLMLAFNQFSANSTLASYNAGAASGDAGGNGRKGAQKIIIFETDGAPNTTATASLTNGGAYKSYYNVRYNSANPGGSQYPSGVSGYSDNASTVTTQIYSLCTQICAMDTASPAGYSSASKKVQIHCIGFGPVFDSTSSGRAAAVATLSQMQTIGNVTDGMPSYKIVTGSESTMIAAMQQAFTKILQNGIQVSLIQ